MVRFLYRKPNSGLQNRVGFFCQMRERSFLKLKLTQSILKSIMVEKSSLTMVKTNIIINDEKYEFTIIASKI
jgi:hypothetical protein